MEARKFQKDFNTLEEWENYITPRVKTFEDGCREVGEDPTDPKFSTGDPDDISYKQGKVVVLALNGGWERDWTNDEQRKWEAWLKYTKTGFRFYDSNYDYVRTYTSGGSRLRLCSLALARYFVEQFGDMMQPFWV